MQRADAILHAPPTPKYGSYQAEYAALLIAHLSQGKSLNTFAAAIGIHRMKLFEWLKKEPEFIEAYEIGRAKSLYWWESLALKHRENPAAYPQFKPRAWIAHMKKNFSDVYAGNQAAI